MIESVLLDQIAADQEGVRSKMRVLMEGLPEGATREILENAELRASKIIKSLKEEASYLRFIE